MIPDAWKTTGYSTPHCHQKSLDTGSQPIHFAAREESLGTGTLTVTDHGTVTACREVYDLAKKKKLTPILGIEAYFRDDHCPALAAAGLERGYFDPENHKDFDPRNPDAADKLARWPDGNYAADFKYGHVTMHALNQTSYEAMGEILSDADARAERHGAERKPLFDWATMERLGGLDLTMGSGCLIGMVARHLVDRNDAATTVAYYERLRSLVKPGNFYVEIFPHDCSRNFVDAVFIDFADGSRERFKPAKTLRVSGEVLHADQLARRKEWGVLEAHSHRRKWFDLPPKKIVKVEAITGFIENECRPWARNSDVQAGVNEFMLALAEKYGDPALISDDSHYATRDEKIVQEVRLSQGGGTLRFYSSYHRQTNAESYEHFRRTLGMLPAEYEKLLDNNRAWADRFRGFEFKYAPSLPAKFYPQDILTHIISKVEEHGRLPDDPRYYERFAQEINLLHHNGTLGLLPYFACAEDVCRGRFTGPGRGSAAGLLLAYLLEITHVDPLKWNLSLDRFLTLDRIKSGKLPDIDLDFPDRKELDDLKTGWLWQRFGDHVAQISSDTTLKVPSAAKDVARLKRGIADENLEALTKKFSKPPQNVDDRKHVFGYTADDGTVVPGSITTDLALQEYIARWPDDWKIVQQCLGLARNKTRHPCGFVIANKPIKSFLPTMTITGVTCTQYTAASVEACGGIKMDFLGVNSLADIEACITMLRARCGQTIPEEGIRIDGRRVPLHHVVPHDGALLNVWDLPDDEAVFREMLAGNTETVFQFNTVGAVRLLKNFDFNLPDGRPSLHDVAGFAAFTALDRPGPLDVKIKDPEIPNTTHNMLVEYARRLRGLPESEDVPAFLKEIFLETFGIMVFQEQLQYVYQYLTGCSGADAEAFRSAVAKKIPDKVQAAFPVFMKGATEKLGAAKARQFWDAIESWAAYGFNKSHAVCYALIGYVCAWLKHHHPLEWWCAVMQNGKKNEVVGSFWAYCGHLIDLPDLTRTAPNFEIQNERIVAPISLLHGIGPKAHEQLLAGAPYADLADLCRRVEKHKRDTGHTEIVRKKFKEGPRGKKVVVERDVEQFYAGHSSVHRGVIYALLISGAADALLPEAMRGGPLLDKLDHYERVFAEVREDKRGKVPEWYGKVGAIGLYLLRKSVLPAYTEDLRPVLADAGVIQRSDGGYVWDDMAVVDGQRFNYLNELEFFPEGGIHVGILAYVQEVKPFVYHGSKKATELTLDVNGTSVSMVAWPGRGGRPPEGVTGDLKGCLVLVACRRKDERDFGLQYVKVIERTPREEKKDVKKGEGSPEVVGGNPGTNPEAAGDRGAEPRGLPGSDAAGVGVAGSPSEG